MEQSPSGLRRVGREQAVIDQGFEIGVVGVEAQPASQPGKCKKIEVGVIDATGVPALIFQLKDLDQEVLLGPSGDGVDAVAGGHLCNDGGIKRPA